MCCVAWFEEEEEEERGKSKEATKKAMEKMSGGTQGRAKSAGRESKCDRVVGKDKRARDLENEWEGGERGGETERMRKKEIRDEIEKREESDKNKSFSDMQSVTYL